MSDNSHQAQYDSGYSDGYDAGWRDCREAAARTLEPLPIGSNVCAIVRALTPRLIPMPPWRE